MMYNTLCTEFYDIDKQFAPADEVDFYKHFFNKKDLILEPMCGSGRLLIPLIQEGYSIHGVDNSTSMLNSCKERAAKLGITSILFETSIETMTLPHQYNLIFIPLGSFQLLYPRQMAFNTLQNFKKHLVPGGKIILDLFVPWDALYENNQEEYSEREVSTPEGGRITIQSHNTANKFEQYLFCKAVYKKVMDDKVIAQENEEMHLCWYYRYEMELILEKQGFKNISYKEEKFAKETHMIFVAEN